MSKLIRSLLFVPGSRPERFEKALAAGADIICIDLEDAVLPADKQIARNTVVEFISKIDHPICVRINPISTKLGEQDLAALAKVNPAYVMLAKCESAADVNKACAALDSSITSQLICLIETPTGLDNAYEIASTSERVCSLMFGGADMSAELRCDFAYEPLLFVRSQLVFAAAKANVNLIDVPYVDITDPQGLTDETHKIKALGYTAKAAIHPNQIATIHQAFRPTDAQVEYATDVLEAVNGQEDAGVIVINGRMVDRPIILAAKKTMQLVNANSE